MNDYFGNSAAKRPIIIHMGLGGYKILQRCGGRPLHGKITPIK